MAIAEAQKVSRFDWQATMRGQFKGDAFVEEAQRFINDANELEQVIHDRRQRIEDDVNLSSQGRNNALAQMREKLRPRVREFAGSAEQYRQTRKRELAKRQEPEPEGDATVIELRAQEIRSNLRGREQGEILGTLQQAGRDGDLETVRAIENAPKSAPLADPDAIDRVREARLAETFPEATQRLADQEALIEMLDTMATHLDRRLEA